jgi:hypothetical protein
MNEILTATDLCKATTPAVTAAVTLVCSFALTKMLGSERIAFEK